MSMSLPGSQVTPVCGELEENPCEGFNGEECGKPSQHKIIGESDSFGDEYYYCCTECLEKLRNWEKENPLVGICDYCNKPDLQLVHYRDIEEGSHGPVYEVCTECRDKHNAYIMENLQDDDDDGDEHYVDEDYDDEEYFPPVTLGYSVMAVYQDEYWDVVYDPEKKHAVLHPFHPTVDYPQQMMKEPADVAILIAVLESGDVTFEAKGEEGLVPRSEIIFQLEEVTD